MSKHDLMESFEVDDGSLNGIPSATIFAMGVEWEIVYRRMVDWPKSFTQLILKENAIRLEALAAKQGRMSECRPTEKEGWWELWIGEKKP